jgi:1A family penicillin-binding protein
LLYEIYVDRKYDPVPLVEIPNHLIQATLSIEDDSFYEHRGFRPLSILRAAKSTIIDKEIQGASTITQQLVKVALLTPERTIERKAKEVVLAYLVEGQYTKNEILELYLNNIPYGGTAWGVQAASQKFFGKNVWELDLAESSFLAGLPSAPTRNSPFNGGFDNAKSRQAQVLSRMLELGYINQQDAEVSYEKELAFAPQVEYIRAPHFVNYAVDELKATYGERMVNFGGLTVTTTLDLDLQDVVQEIVTSEVADNSNLNITNGASLVLDARLGEVLAYVGSVDYFSENDGEYDVVRAERSPGSSLKPVTYALALSNGHTPASVVTDAPLTIQSYGQTYSPKNYDNRYHGTVTLRQALANSYNIPAVKILKRVGIENMVELGKRMGLKTWELDSSYGWSITLGGKEVRLLDLANVYATFAREGMYKDITPFLSVKDINGFEIYKDKRAEEQVLNSDVAYLITNILSDNLARAPAFGYSNSLVVPDRTVAVKTGTSEEKRDNLTVGYTPTYVVAVWTGNNDNTPMHPQLSSGLSGAAPIWNRVMSYVLDGTENETFNRPDNIFVKIDSECKGKSEVFIKGTAPEHLCEVDKDKVDDKKRLTVIGGEF